MDDLEPAVQTAALVLKRLAKSDKVNFISCIPHNWNKLSHDCVNASSVNMFTIKFDSYLARAGYT